MKNALILRLIYLISLFIYTIDIKLTNALFIPVYLFQPIYSSVCKIALDIPPGV